MNRTYRWSAYLAIAATVLCWFGEPGSLPDMLFWPCVVVVLASLLASEIRRHP